jgi:hypothetical protein
VEELLIEGNAYRRDVGIDILLTSEFGEGFDNLLEPEKRPSYHASSEASGEVVEGVELSVAVGRLGKELSPRYHFAGSSKTSFVLPPYRNNVGVSRFYGIEGPNGGKVVVM